MADTLYATLADALSDNWRRKARPEQIAPNGDWLTWLVMAGRGFGKTRTGSEWVHEQVAAGARRIALVGPTAADVRDTMVEGVSGLLATAPRWARPEYEPSKRRLTWPNGTIGTMFSAEEPDRLRGPEHDTAWCDEVGAWQNQQSCWDMLQFGLRLGTRPRALVTTTPKPSPVLRKLLAEEGQGVVVTRGRTLDNAANLPEPFLKAIKDRYAGTRLGRQEMDGELLLDVPGALWSLDVIEKARVVRPPELRRIVVAVDPAVSNNEGSDETGIIVAGIDSGRTSEVQAYILADASGRYAPHEWARKAVALFEQFKADRVVAEANQGGDMVTSTLRTVAPNLPISKVHASRGKVTRAEPVAALYEQGKVHHAGMFAQLEDQMCGFTSDFNRSSAGYSPDRVDALVWALSELVLRRSAPVAQSRPFSWG